LNLVTNVVKGILSRCSKLVDMNWCSISFRNIG
jgi:hypothetical protein